MKIKNLILPILTFIMLASSVMSVAPGIMFTCNVNDSGLENTLCQTASTCTYDIDCQDVNDTLIFNTSWFNTSSFRYTMISTGPSIVFTTGVLTYDVPAYPTYKPREVYSFVIKVNTSDAGTKTANFTWRLEVSDSTLSSNTQFLGSGGLSLGQMLINLAPGVGFFIVVLIIFGGVGALIYAISGLIRSKLK